MNNKLLDFVLMKKELEMGNKLNQEQETKFKQLETVYNSDDTIKQEIDKLLNADSLNQAYDILAGKVIEKPVIQQAPVTETILNSDNQGGTSMTNEQQKVLVLSNNKRAGFADALIMALVTGFVGGIATTILFMLI